MDTKKLVVIDGNALVHRAFHALPPMMSEDGRPVNAVYGFLLVFLKAINDIQPDHIVSTFDLPGPTFRKEMYKEYKAKRVKAPQELYDQIPIIKEVLEVFEVPVFEKPGFEADDVIGTIARMSARQQISPKVEVFIVTGDLDALRLVDDNVRVYTLRKGLKDTIIYDVDLVKERYNGLSPEQLTDYRALRGDPSDNIPGVNGIGEKTAIELLKEFNTLEDLYSAIKELRTPLMKDRIRNLLAQSEEQAFFSKTLAEINTEVEIDFNLKDYKKVALDRKKIIAKFKELGFYSLIKRLPEGDVWLGEF